MSRKNQHLVCPEDAIPLLGSRVLETRLGNIAIFRTGEGEVFAIDDRCPHKGGPLSQGIVHGKTVTCPLHSWKIDLSSGEALAPDVGCTHHYKVWVDEGQVMIELPEA
jgi:nitrite reductase (NADH) small subunit